MKKFFKKFWKLYKKIPCCLSFGILMTVFAIVYTDVSMLILGWIMAAAMLLIDAWIGYFRAAHEIARDARKIAKMKPRNEQEAIEKQTALLSAMWFFRRR